jgi:hypothetical protein
MPCHVFFPFLLQLFGCAVRLCTPTTVLLSTSEFSGATALMHQDWCFGLAWLECQALFTVRKCSPPSTRCEDLNRTWLHSALDKDITLLAWKSSGLHGTWQAEVAGGHSYRKLNVLPIRCKCVGAMSVWVVVARAVPGAKHCSGVLSPGLCQVPPHTCSHASRFV